MEKYPNGLIYIDNVLNEAEQDFLIKFLDKRQWKPLTSSLNSRVVQQYGFEYNYFNKTAINKASPIPDVLSYLADFSSEKCKELLGQELVFNQIIANNYNKSQSISKHIDSNNFGCVIVCFSLGETCIIEFEKDEETIQLQVKGGSLYIMSGESRYNWTHKMHPLKSGRRISLTFRIVD